MSYDRELDEVLAEAGTLADKSQIARFIHSKQDADAINRIREKINNARQNFQVRLDCVPLDCSLHALARSFRAELLLRSSLEKL